MNDQCKICHGKNLKQIIIAKPRLLYHACEDCLFIAKDDNDILSESEELKRYQLHENDCSNEGYVNMFKNFIEHAVSPWQSEISTILDFGCGPGPVLAQLLEQENYQVDLYDKFFYQEKNYLQHQYDMICSTEVFEHLADPLATILHLKDHLCKNGKIAIMTRFHNNDHKAFLNWHYRREETHISFFHIETLKRLADASGLKLIYHDNKEIAVFAINKTGKNFRS